MMQDGHYFVNYPSEYLTQKYNKAKQIIFNYFFENHIPEPYKTETVYIDNQPYKKNYYQNDKVIISERESNYYCLTVTIKDHPFKMQGVLFGDNYSDYMHYVAYKNVLIFNGKEYSRRIETAEENRGPWHIMPDFIEVLENDKLPDLI